MQPLGRAIQHIFLWKKALGVVLRDKKLSMPPLSSTSQNVRCSFQRCWVVVILHPLKIQVSHCSNCNLTFLFFLIILHSHLDLLCGRFRTRGINAFLENLARIKFVYLKSPVARLCREDEDVPIMLVWDSLLGKRNMHHAQELSGQNPELSKQVCLNLGTVFPTHCLGSSCKGMILFWGQSH